MEVNPDLFAIPAIDQTPNGIQFNFARALPVTTYLCPNCGRFKFMSAIFLNNLEIPQPQGVQAAANNEENLTSNETDAVA